MVYTGTSCGQMVRCLWKKAFPSDDLCLCFIHHSSPVPQPKLWCQHVLLLSCPGCFLTLILAPSPYLPLQNCIWHWACFLLIRSAIDCSRVTRRTKFETNCVSQGCMYITTQLSSLLVIAIHEIAQSQSASFKHDKFSATAVIITWMYLIFGMLSCRQSMEPCPLFLFAWPMSLTSFIQRTEPQLLVS